METKTIRELCDIVVDCPHSTPKWTTSGKIVIRNNNIKKGRIDFSSPSYTDDEHFNLRVKRAIPRSGDIIITREAPMGEVGMIPERIECCLGQRMVLLRTNPDICDNYYLLYSLQSKFVQHQISWSEGTGTTVSNLRIPHLEQLKIPYVPLKKQRLVASVLKSIEEKIILNEQINNNLLQQASSIFKAWFIDPDISEHEDWQIEKSKKMLGQMESVLGAQSTIESLCDDIVNHYEKYRANLLTGKAMIVAYSRPIAMKIYRRILEIRPNWKEKIGVVMTSGNNDPEDWKEIIGTKSHKEEI